jgi:hypothetical protein
MDSCGIRGRARQATNENIILLMRIACWIPKATNTNLQYVILIAFPLQQWLQERVSLLRYMNIASHDRLFIFIAHLIWELHKLGK